jgi:hypothetical protein
VLQGGPAPTPEPCEHAFVLYADALLMLFELADREDERFQVAAARWHARFVLEAGSIGLLESQLALAAVAALPVKDGKAVAAIRELAGHYRVPNIEAALRRLI